MRETFGPQERIRKKRDFDRLYKGGNRIRGRFLTLVYLDSTLAFSRLGVVASRKVGGAVLRNKVKRRMRELFRRNKSLFGLPADIVAIAKAGAAQAPWPDFREDFLLAVQNMAKKRMAK